jgi:ribose transport system substrate-binding protein
MVRVAWSLGADRYLNVILNVGRMRCANESKLGEVFVVVWKETAIIMFSRCGLNGETALKKLRCVISLPNENAYQRLQAQDAQATARSLGVDVEIISAENDVLTHSQQLLERIQVAKESRPDAILVEPLSETGFRVVAEAAVKAGIAWVVLNFDDLMYIDQLRRMALVPVFAVTRDHTEIGRIQGRQFAALLPNGGNLLYIQGPSTSSASSQRTIGMLDTKPDNISVEMLRSAWTEEGARRAAQAWVSLATNRTSDIDLVGCQYDGIAKGARQAVDDTATGAERERWLKVPFTGVDGLPDEGQAWVQQGLLAATVIAPTTTPDALKILVQALRTREQPNPRNMVELSSLPVLSELARSRARPMVARQ